MGVFYETIPNSLKPWILDQKVFWIASAPLSALGHVNVSPKGGKYFGIVDERTFWYMDLTGSGVETTSHLHEPGNGRITVLFNAFEGQPRIVRFWGKGKNACSSLPKLHLRPKGNKMRHVAYISILPDEAKISPRLCS